MHDRSSEAETALRWVTAIDVVIIPDMTLIRHAIALNARLTEPGKIHSLDAAYHLRLTTLQCFVTTAALLDVYAATGAVLRDAAPAAWELTAVGYEAVEQDDDTAVLRLLVRPAEAWLQMQHQLVFALVPHFDLPGTEEPFALSGDEAEIDPAAVERVAAYIPNETGTSFRPHLDIGSGSASAVGAIASQPFEPFTFRPAGAAIYHLGCDATARVRLKWWVFPPEGSDLNPDTPYRAWKQSQSLQGARTSRRRPRRPEQ